MSNFGNFGPNLTEPDHLVVGIDRDANGNPDKECDFVSRSRVEKETLRVFDLHLDLDPSLPVSK